MYLLCALLSLCQKAFRRFVIIIVIRFLCQLDFGLFSSRDPSFRAMHRKEKGKIFRYSQWVNRKSTTPNHVRDLLPRVHLHVARKAGGRPSWPRTGSAQHSPCHLTAACRRRPLHGPSARGTAPQPGAGASRTKELYSVCVRVRILSHSDAECVFSKTCRIASLVPFGSFMVSGCGAPAPSVPDKTTPYLRDPFPRSI